MKVKTNVKAGGNNQAAVAVLQLLFTQQASGDSL
jgi:hypothetical protein